MAVSLSFHLRMPPSGGIAESRNDNYGLWDNLSPLRTKTVEGIPFEKVRS